MKLRALVVAAAVVLGFAGGAVAGVVGGGPPAFTLDITGAGEPLHLTPTLTANGNGTYSAIGQGGVAGSFSLLFDLVLNPDPAISGSFTLTNLSGSTQTFTVGASISGLTPIAAPTRVGGSYGETTYTDTSGDGILGFGTAGTNPFYRAEIDGGSVQDLGSFAFSEIASDPGVIGTLSKEAFGTPIPSAVGPGVSGSIGVSFPGFMLTAGDRIEVPFEFVVVPEPGTASLFAMCLALVLFKVAQETASRRRGASGRIWPTGG